MSERLKHIGQNQYLQLTGQPARPGGVAAGISGPALSSLSLASLSQFAIVSYSIHTLSNVDKGTEVGLGGAGIIKIYSDLPVDIYVNDYPNPFSQVRRADIVGYPLPISRIFLRRKTLSAITGTIKIVYAYPLAAVDYTERPVQNLPTLFEPISALSTAAGTSWDSGVRSVPDGTICTEGRWLRSIQLHRTSPGLIYTLKVMVNVSTPYEIAGIDQTGSGRGYVSWEPPVPIKIPFDYFLRITGDSVVGTQIDGDEYYSAQ